MARAQSRARGFSFDLEEIQEPLDRARKRVDRFVTRTWHEALDRLPTQPRRAVKDVQGRVEELTADLRRRSTRAQKAFDKQRKRLVDAVQERTADVVEPLASTLGVASHDEVERLTRRVAKLEKQLKARKSPRRTKQAASA